jgi:hypothetical protein
MTDLDTAIRGARYMDGGASINAGDAEPIDEPLTTPYEAGGWAYGFWMAVAAAAFCAAIGYVLGGLPLPNWN